MNDTPRPDEVLSTTVGYRRPPKESRFRPGTSGNPRGRPKGRQNWVTIIKQVGESLLDYAQHLLSNTLRILDQAVVQGDDKLALVANREARDNIRLLQEILKERKEANPNTAADKRGNGQEIVAEGNVCPTCGQVKDWQEEQRKYIVCVRRAMGFRRSADRYFRGRESTDELPSASSE